MKRILILAICLATFSIFAYSTTYYASPSGNGDGTTLQKAGDFTTLVKKLKAGDTLYLLEGQYNLQNVQLSASGTSTNPIIVCNAPDVTPKTAILDFRTQPYGDRGLQIREGANYWVIRGLTLRYSGKNALHNSGSNNIFDNLDVYGNGDTGVQMKAGGNNQIINVDSHDNCDYQLGGLNAADFGGNADGFADKQYTGGANIYLGCRAWNNSDDGWDFFQRVTSGTTPTQLIGCICYKNGPAYYDFSNHGRYETDKTWFDQFLTERTITDADGNKIQASLTKYPNIGNGNGFKIGGGSTNNIVLLEHCLAVGNTVKGFDQNNNFGTMTVFNCSAYQNGQDYGFANNSGGSLTIRNCISYKSQRTNDLRCKSVTSDHNSWNTSGITVSNSDFLSLDTTLILTPRQADGSLQDVAFMHLTEGSKLIDAGVDVGLAYKGKAPDLGCYEYGSGSVILPATLNITEGSLSQTLRLGNPVSPVSMTWGGSATDISYSTLPQGIIANKDAEAKTITFSGTPVEVGNYQVSVTTISETTNKTITISFLVKEASSSYKVAYVTLPNDDRDNKILDRLNQNVYFDITICDATATNTNFADYDLIVISPVPSSTAAGLATLKTINKPTLLLKPFMLKNTVWNWGNSQNTTEKTIHITNPNHKIFNGITLSADNTLTVFSQVSTYGVTCIDGWYNSSVSEIATPQTASGQTIVEAKAGTNMNGTTIQSDFLMIGVSEYSTANLTDDATKLIDNACCYLLGISIGTTITSLTDTAISGDDIIYTITGMPVAKGEEQLQNLPAGIYIFNGKKIARY